jgi:hypothetical protein
MMYGKILKAYLNWDFYEVEMSGELMAFRIHCFVLWFPMLLGLITTAL